MNKKSISLVISLVLLVVIIGAVIAIQSNSSTTPTPSSAPKFNPSVNTIPVSERPFVTLAPDAIGRSLFLGLNQTASQEIIEYELIYQAGSQQEGVFGRFNLATAEQPIEKKLLLGSKSAGGKTTYHEGITGGSLTLTYGDIKLKEQFNFLHFDPTNPNVSSPDARFAIEFTKFAFRADSVIVTMKTFGLPTVLTGNLIAGPYAFLTSSRAKGDVKISITLPAGQHIDPIIRAFAIDSNEWVVLATTLDADDVTATTSAGFVFVVTTQ